MKQELDNTSHLEASKMAPPVTGKHDTTTGVSTGRSKQSSAAKASKSSVSNLDKISSPIRVISSPAKSKLKKTSLMEIMEKHQPVETSVDTEDSGAPAHDGQSSQVINSNVNTVESAPESQGPIQKVDKWARVGLPPLVPPGTKDIAPLVEAMNSMYTLLSASQHELAEKLEGRFTSLEDQLAHLHEKIEKQNQSVQHISQNLVSQSDITQVEDTFN